MANVVPADQRADPRELLSNWANGSDEWVRYTIRQVLIEGNPLDAPEASTAYALFRQEKAFDARALPVEDRLATFEREDGAIEPLRITSLSEVTGINALIEGGVI